MLYSEFRYKDFARFGAAEDALLSGLDEKVASESGREMPKGESEVEAGGGKGMTESRNPSGKKKESVEQLKEAGNSHFKAKQYRQALCTYTRAIEQKEKERKKENKRGKRDECLAALYSNRAATRVKLAETNCTTGVASLDVGGLDEEDLGNFDERPLADLDRSIEVDPLFLRAYVSLSVIVGLKTPAQTSQLTFVHSRDLSRYYFARPSPLFN